MSADPRSTGPHGSDPQAHPDSSRVSDERHHLIVSAAAQRLARELTLLGCPMPVADLAARCGSSHWSAAALDEAIAEAERAGWIRRMPLGWVAPLPARRVDAPA